jgi:hypothetical protein
MKEFFAKLFRSRRYRNYKGVNMNISTELDGQMVFDDVKIYVVVSGPGWGDVTFYGNVAKAQNAFIRAYVALQHSSDQFIPKMIEYVDNMGTFMHSAVYWIDAKEFQRLPFTLDEVDDAPERAFCCIRL